MLKVAVLVSGGGTNLQSIIDAVARKEIDCEIVKVISSKVGAFALKRAEKAGIPSETVDYKSFGNGEEFSKAMLKAVVDAQADLVVLTGFLKVLSSEFIEKYRNKIINVHPSLIPSFCGKGFYGIKVHEAVLAAGVKITGATVHFVDEGCDSGPIILQKAINVEDEDTAETLQKRVMEEAEWVLLPKAIGLIAEGRVKVKDNRVFLEEKRV